MKKLIIILLVLAAFFALGAIALNKFKATVPASTSSTVQQKVGTTTKTGTISVSNNIFYLQEAGQTPKEIDSYTVDLGQYVGQSVTVSGQYSGDTLFVGSVVTK
mgnify:FL=1